MRVQPAPPNNGYTGNEVNPCTPATPRVTHWIRTGFAPATAPPERQPALGHTSSIRPSADSGDAGGYKERPRQGLQAEHSPFQKGSARPASPGPQSRPRRSGPSSQAQPCTSVRNTTSRCAAAAHCHCPRPPHAAFKFPAAAPCHWPVRAKAAS